MKIKVNPAYQKLVHPLSQDEYADLKESISKNSQYLPIIINSANEILDGHHRWKILNELNQELKINLKPRVTVKHFPDKLAEKLFVIDCNLKRRHLNSFQRIELALKSKPIIQSMAKQNMIGGITLDLNKSKVDTNKEIGVRSKTAKDTVRKVETILKNASESEIINLREGKKSINEVFKTIKNNKLRQNLVKSKPLMELPEGCKLLCGDFMKMSKVIPDNSIDLVLTDPPYDNVRKSIEIYRNLGNLSYRVLKEGGSLVCYVGRQALPQFINAVLESGLKWHWMLCVHHNGQHTQMFQRKIFVRWKPLLWLIKGEKINEYVKSFNDFIDSSRLTKI